MQVQNGSTLRPSPFWDGVIPQCRPRSSRGAGAEAFPDISRSALCCRGVSSCLRSTGCRTSLGTAGDYFCLSCSSWFKLLQTLAVWKGLCSHECGGKYGMQGAEYEKFWMFFPSWKGKLWTEVCIFRICRAFLWRIKVLWHCKTIAEMSLFKNRAMLRENYLYFMQRFDPSVKW